MSERYRYWGYKLEKKSRRISLRVHENIEEKIEQAREKLEEIEKERAEAKVKRDNAPEQNRISLGYEYMAKDNEYMKTKSELIKLEEHYKVLRRNNGMELKIQRLKDIYSRKESICVVLLHHGIEEAKIISTSTKIKEEIYQLEEYGVFLTPPYFDELASIIRDIYYDIVAEEREFIENDIPEETVKAIVIMCKEELEACDKEKRDNYLSKDGGYYYIPVKDFRQWYESSAFRKFSLTSIKEALIIHGYAKGNKGRNEYTVSGVGKVVCLIKSALEKVEKKDEK